MAKTVKKNTAAEKADEKAKAAKQASEKEAAEKESAEKAKAEKEAAEKEAAEKAKAEKEAAEKESAEKAKAEKEAADKKAGEEKESYRQKRAREVFKSHPGVEKLYFTSDDTCFIKPQFARLHAENLKEEKIDTVTKKDVK